jgi:hypothetical protein
MYFMSFAYFAQMSQEKNQQMDFQPNDMHKEEKRTLQYNYLKETNVCAMFSMFNDVLVILTAKLSILFSTFT